MDKVIIFNGPPGSGKDTGAAYLQSKGYNHLRFKDSLIALTSLIYSVPEADIEELLESRDGKERSDVRFGGKSLRQALIYVSEGVIKPNFGKDFFGVKAAHSILRSDNELHVMSDGGFETEINTFIQHGFRVLLIHIHREGHDFSGDSRQYVYPKNLIKGDGSCHYFVIKNDWSIENFYAQIDSAIDTYKIAIEV